MSQTKHTRIVLDYDTDSISMSTPTADWRGNVKFEVEVWRKNRTGKFEALTITASMAAEDLACVLRRAKLGLREAIGELRERADDLEAEL